MFNGSDTCESTHSQSRRMIMVSPEPNFWIHAVSDYYPTAMVIKKLIEQASDSV